MYVCPSKKKWLEFVLNQGYYFWFVNWVGENLQKISMIFLYFCISEICWGGIFLLYYLFYYFFSGCFPYEPWFLIQKTCLKSYSRPSRVKVDAWSQGTLPWIDVIIIIIMILYDSMKRQLCFERERCLLICKR